MMKKVLALALCVCMAAMLLAGCGGAGSSSAAASGSAFLAAALCALWFALDLCGLLPPALTLFALAHGLPGNKLFLCLAGLAFTALAVSIRLRADSSRQT